MKIVSSAILSLCFLFVGTAHARIIFPHIVVGGDGIAYETVVQISSQTNLEWTGRALLQGTQGAEFWPGEWWIESVDERGNLSVIEHTGRPFFDIQIPGHGSRTYILFGGLELHTGFMELWRAPDSPSGKSAASGLSVSVVYKAFAGNELISTVGIPGVPADSPSSLFTIPISKGPGHNTGLAFVFRDRSGSTTTDKTIIAFTLRDRNGNVLEQTLSLEDSLIWDDGSGPVRIADLHDAAFVDEIFQTLIDAEGFDGTIRIECRLGPCYPLALRMDFDDFGGFLITSIPVLPD